MTHDEKQMLRRIIDALELDEGTVEKTNGVWHVTGTQANAVPRPKINLSYWCEEDARHAIIEQK